VNISTLNYHHLRYFWAVAKEGSLTRTAERLHVSQSALSAQIRHLEDQIGQPLFLREGRRLVVTEAGQIALAYAEEIFAAGTELVSTLKQGRSDRHALRIGAVATLSRNFQESFVKPLLGRPDMSLRLVSGRLDDLLGRLAGHTLDLVLSNRPVAHDPEQAWRSLRIAKQRVSLVGHRGRAALRLPDDLDGLPMLLPGTDSEIRTAFDALCAKRGVRPRVLAEVDDMAMLRLLARDTEAVALLPSVVVRDELRSGALKEYGVVPGIDETFYAITVERRFPHPLLAHLLTRKGVDLLAAGPGRQRRAPR
jgi:LysR family transcriptional activator of nhaA